IPIGKPIDNINLYILGENNSLLSIGIPGELCIGGVGLARGYLNNQELTNEKFVENPFCLGEKMYRTGDLAKWLPDGNIEFLGRMDHQIKIRGYRIELGEIEARLLKYEGIKEAIVLLKEDATKSNYLCVYIVSEKELKIQNIKEYLSEELPSYMIPSCYVQLEKMPLAANGKLDRKSLPEPDESMTMGAEYIPPSNSTEERLAEIWKETLGIKRVGINDNFFDVGGHSLKAALLVSKIYKEFNVEIPLREVFNNPVIKELAEYIKSSGESTFSPVIPVEKREYYPLSSAQKRIYILNQLEGEGTSYNMPTVMSVEGYVDKDRLEKSFEQLVERHELLRTSFETVNGEPMQQVHSEAEFKIEYIEADENCKENKINDFVRTFDLSQAPLLRLRLIKVTKDRHLLLFDMHHIISDGTSMNVIIRDFKQIYEGKELSKLRIQYKDYSVWQNKLLKSDRIEKQEKYWINTFSGDIPVLNMPLDYQRPPVQSFEGSRIVFESGQELICRLEIIAKETQTTIYMVLLAAYNILLYKYTGQKDIVVGTPIAGRPYEDFQDIIGMFVNTIAIRNNFEECKSYKDLLLKVKENALQAYENQDYPFEELVEKLDIQRDMGRNPLFDTMFVLQNTGDMDININELSFNPYPIENKVSKFDITLYAVERNNKIYFELEYCAKLYKKGTMERLAGHYINILNEISTDIQTGLSEISMLSQQEKDQILYQFNDTKTEYQRDKTIHQLFEEQVEKTPDNIAVVFGKQQLTYRELNRKANQLATALRKKGVKAGTIVGIMLERSIEMIVGIMGILKSGGGYLPIDLEYPQERIKYMLSDSKAEILLVKNNIYVKIEIPCNTININLDNEDIYIGESSNLQTISNSETLVYVIYTSGSTGRPKGVIIPHRNVINTLASLQKKYPFVEKDSYLMKTTFTFDVSVCEIFGWFFTGGRLVILPESEHKNPISILEAVNKYGITHINFVPSMFGAFLDVLDNHHATQKNKLKYIFAAGEALPIEQVRIFNDITINTGELVNLYGPTEATIYATECSTCNLKEGASIVPIGKPIQNINTYIVDKDKKLLPIGVPGELCISGEGLARGYLNNQELT
ncbi:MAG: amino acid adenylation domain-containing protein, partial [Ruminiclostridium sp.]